MEWIGEWMNQLILFLVAAFLIEILLPSSSFRTYARLVLSFVLMLLIIEPLLTFTQVPREIETEWGALLATETISMEEEIEEKKTEIEAGQEAYISNQVAEKLTEQVEETIQSRWGWEIDAIQLHYDESKIENVDEWLIQVSLVEKEEQNFRAPIRVERKYEDDVQSTKELKREISQYLAEAWQVEASQLEITMGGGERRGRGR